MTPRGYDLALLPGDGIGPEVIDVAVDVLTSVAAASGFQLRFTSYDLGAEHYLATGEALPADTVAALRAHDAILFGACGHPKVAPGILERGLVLALRLAFDEYVNLRPVRLLPGVPTLFADLAPERVDLVVLRENTEGLYGGGGGTLRTGTRHEVATQVSINTRVGVERLVRYGFDLARRRHHRLTLCHKTNILTYAGDLWQRTVDETADEFPDVEVDYVHVDAMTMHLLREPERFDVVVTENLFGDIITDLAAVLQGGLGYAAAANLNPERSAPSMFEPVHGSAPDIAGTGRANPVAAVLSAALLLDHLQEASAADAVRSAVATAVADAASADPATVSTSAIGQRILASLPRRESQEGEVQ